MMGWRLRVNQRRSLNVGVRDLQVTLSRSAAPTASLYPRRGRSVHGQPPGPVAELVAMPGLDQRDRKPAQRSATANAKGLPLAGWQDGAALGRRRPAHDRAKLSQDDGLPGPLDAECGPG